MIKEWYNVNKEGFSLVEVILSVALSGLFVVALAGVYLSGEENSLLVSNRNRALFLAEEGIEATRSIRDASFANLAVGTYGLGLSAGSWIFSGTSDLTDIYTREITVSDYDTNVKEVLSRVTWQQNPQPKAQAPLFSA